MKPSQLLELMRNPAVKKEIAKQVNEAINQAAKKENANSKQAARREKRG
jgi:hypothetical protein